MTGSLNHRPSQAHVRAHIDAAGFRWVNPKARAMVSGAATGFARPDHRLADVALIAPWAGSGQLLSRFLSDPRALRVFNFGMAALLVASIWPGLRTRLTAA